MFNKAKPVSEHIKLKKPQAESLRVKETQIISAQKTFKKYLRAK